MDIEQTILDNMPLVKSISRKYYYKNNLFSVEDLEQVGYLALWKNLKKYDPNRGCLSTFITVCVKNDIIKFTSKQRSSEKREARSEYSDDHNLFEATPTSKLQKKILSLRYEGFSIKDIAQNLKISINKVRNNLNRIREKYEN